MSFDGKTGVNNKSYQRKRSRAHSAIVRKLGISAIRFVKFLINM
jgi:hypothetical protein